MGSWRFSFAVLSSTDCLYLKQWCATERSLIITHFGDIFLCFKLAIFRSPQASLVAFRVWNFFKMERTFL